MSKRREIVKENYTRLRAAGYSAADARKLRYHSQENINKALASMSKPVEVIKEVVKASEPTRREVVKDNYAKLRAAGYSAADARKLRYHSPENINKALAAVAKPLSKAEQARENYAKLRAAGFNAADARRYRGASAANIAKVIKEKQLPAIDPKKRGAVKPKIKTRDYKASKVKSIELPDVSDVMLNKAVAFIKDNRDYPFLSVVITLTYANGISITFSSPMTPSKDITNIKELSYIIEDLMTDYMDKYGLESGENPMVDMQVNLWMPGGK